MDVERVDFLSVLTQDIARAERFYHEVLGTIPTSVCRQAWFKDPDGNALMLHRRVDV
jgi:predicted enzyme related to lactoylglutathione lyase